MDDASLRTRILDPETPMLQKVVNYRSGLMPFGRHSLRTCLVACLSVENWQHMD
jgi:hypothetical protein